MRMPVLSLTPALCPAPRCRGVAVRDGQAPNVDDEPEAGNWGTLCQASSLGEVQLKVCVPVRSFQVAHTSSGGATVLHRHVGEQVLNTGGPLEPPYSTRDVSR
jgi:hypothetical protein